jgi:hypothetical protein
MAASDAPYAARNSTIPTCAESRHIPLGVSGRACMCKGATKRLGHFYVHASAVRGALVTFPYARSPCFAATRSGRSAAAQKPVHARNTSTHTRNSLALASGGPRAR